MRIAFAINVRVKMKFNFPGVDQNGIINDTYLTLVTANISSDSEEKDRLAFHTAGETACSEAVAFFKKGYQGCDIFTPTIQHFQIIP